jgi:L-ascorbate metabolism protein UlaG (beta-lactamase superfamily)
MGPEDVLRAVKLIQPKHVIPILYNTFGLIAHDIDKWEEQLEREISTLILVLNPVTHTPSID